MLPRWLGLLVAIALLLAGCSAQLPDDDGKKAPRDGPNDTDPSDGRPPAGNPAEQIEPMNLVDCWLDPFAFTVDGSKTAALVPPPYNTTSSQLGSVGLQVYACDSVVINNQTVLKEIAFAITLVPVEPPEDWQGPAGTRHVYVLEVFAPDHLAPAFSRAGFEVIVANVTTGAESGSEVEVSVEGAAWYSAVLAGHRNQRSPETQTLRHHYANASGPLWFDAERTYELASVGDEVHLEATDGILADVSTVPGRLVGGSTPGYVDGVIRFGGPG